MRIGIIGGTGKEGRGLAVRWARAGHNVMIGSRDADRALTSAAELSAFALRPAAASIASPAVTATASLAGSTPAHPHEASAPATCLPAASSPAADATASRAPLPISGGDNAACIAHGEVVLLAVPYPAHADTLRALAPALPGRILIDITVPLRPPQVRTVHLPPGHSAALEAQALLGPTTPVVATLHHVSSSHLADPAHPIEGDVLLCTDDDRARTTAIALLRDLGLSPIDAGPLANAVALEAMTPVLLHINRAYKISGAGLRITGLDRALEGLTPSPSPASWRGEPAQNFRIQKYRRFLLLLPLATKLERGSGGEALRASGSAARPICWRRG